VFHLQTFNDETVASIFHFSWFIFGVLFGEFFLLLTSPLAGLFASQVGFISPSQLLIKPHATVVEIFVQPCFAKFSGHKY